MEPMYNIQQFHQRPISSRAWTQTMYGSALRFEDTFRRLCRWLLPRASQDCHVSIAPHECPILLCCLSNCGIWLAIGHVETVPALCWCEVTFLRRIVPHASELCPWARVWATERGSCVHNQKEWVRERESELLTANYLESGFILAEAFWLWFVKKNLGGHPNSLVIHR